MREEVKELRQDLHGLRDKNHALLQDNIRLTEHIKDLQQLHGLDAFSGSASDVPGVARAPSPTRNYSKGGGMCNYSKGLGMCNYSKGGGMCNYSNGGGMCNY